MIVAVFLGAGVMTREATLPAEALAGIFDGDVVMAGRTLEPVTGIDPGEVFVPTVTLEEVRPSVLIIPGGFGCRPMARDRSVIPRVREIAMSCDGVLSISTGTLLLAATGLLEGQPVAGHWLTGDELEPYGCVLSENQLERSGHLFTASGGQAALEAVPLLANVILYGPRRAKGQGSGVQQT